MIYDVKQLKPGYKGTFVIQEHDATKKHWDFRLEFPKGSASVLRSWSVPKHTVPSDSSLLAIETEDHPVEYGKFEWTIPKGQYGAGKVSVKDKGTFQLVDVDYDKKYVFDLDGSSVKGRYALVKTDGKKFLWSKVKGATKYPKQAMMRMEMATPYLKGGRDYGEYCTDFIEQNALELYMLGKFKEYGCVDLRNQIEARNPHTKIFQQGIVKIASKSKIQEIAEEIIKHHSKSRVVQPLRERRDYGKVAEKIACEIFDDKSI